MVCHRFCLLELRKWHLIKAKYSIFLNQIILKSDFLLVLLYLYSDLSLGGIYD